MNVCSVSSYTALLLLLCRGAELAISEIFNSAGASIIKKLPIFLHAGKVTLEKSLAEYIHDQEAPENPLHLDATQLATAQSIVNALNVLQGICCQRNTNTTLPEAFLVVYFIELFLHFPSHF